MARLTPGPDLEVVATPRRRPDPIRADDLNRSADPSSAVALLDDISSSYRKVELERIHECSGINSCR